jgi:hypothetical protein
MPPESWLVVTVAGAFLLLGIAGSPLAWALLHQRRSRSEQLIELRWRELADQVRALENRQTQHESIKPDFPGMRSLGRADSPGRRGSVRADGTHEPALIAVPNLEGEPHDRDVTASGLKERYAAIWALADTGAKPDVIARATGQPVGQIELILGLRRQIDGTRTIFSHAPHAS